MPVRIYHNPRCSKSRQALALLRERGVEPEIIEYLKAPLDRKTLKKLLGMLGMQPADILRRKEAAFKQAGLDRPGIGDGDILAALEAHPILLERPIVSSENRAVIGRPPENALSLLE